MVLPPEMMKMSDWYKGTIIRVDLPYEISPKVLEEMMKAVKKTLRTYGIRVGVSSHKEIQRQYMPSMGQVYDENGEPIVLSGTAADKEDFEQ